MFKNFFIFTTLLFVTYKFGSLCQKKAREETNNRATKSVVVESSNPYFFKPPRELSLEEAVATIPSKYGVDPVAVKVLIKKESNGNMQAERFEPHKLQDAKKYSSCPKEQKKISSSHCALQVFGLEAARRQIHWSELKKPEVCVELGMAIWLEKELLCRKKLKSPTRYDLLKCTAKRYNGGGQAANRYAEKFMEDYARLSINKG